MRAGRILFTTRTLVVTGFLAFGVVKSLGLESTMDLGFVWILLGLPRAGVVRELETGKLLLLEPPADLVLSLALLFVFDFTAILFSRFLSCHFIGNILLEALTDTFKWDTLEDRVEEPLHDDLFGFGLRNTA